MKLHISMSIRLKFIILIIASFLLAGGQAWAACSWDGTTGTAASCSRDDVYACLSHASCVDGATVIIPTGTCTWTSGITLDLDTANKALTIQGSGANETIIRPNWTHGWASTCFWITTDPNKSLTLSNIKFQSGGSESGTYGVFTIAGTSKTVRITNCYFDQLKCFAIRFMDYINGVVDNCTLVTGTEYTWIYAAMEDYSGTTNADGSWAADPTLGSSDAIFIEDCSFTGTSAKPIVMDMAGGTRMVIRYNTFTNAQIETHGTDSSGRLRSVRTFELYHNTFTTANNESCVSGLRGGTGVYHNNTFTGYQHGIRLWLLRVGNSYAPWGQCDDATASGLCSEDNSTYCTVDGDCSGTCQHWTDDPSGDGIGYPCRDQPGRGKDTGPCTAQALEPIYEWSNTLDAADVDFWVEATYSSYIVEDTDYYNDTSKPAYTAYTYPHPLRGADVTPPVIGNIVPLPTVEYPSTTTEVTVTWDTDECAVCRIGEVDEADEDDLTNLATVETQGACGVGYGTSFSYEFTGLSDNDSVTAYIGGEDESEGNETTDNEESAFTIYQPPPGGERLIMVWE